MPEAYPLDWPLTVPRTPARERKRGRFGKRNDRGYGLKDLTTAEALKRLFAEIEKYTQAGREWRADPDDVIVSSNVRTRNDGLPYSNAREPDDPGVCVYFNLDGVDIALPCDTFDRVADNIAAIAGHIEADRRQERYGVGRTEQRYAGFKQLPEHGSGRPWWVVLGVDHNADFKDVKTAYRRKARETHPDAGGSSDAFQQVQEAWRQAQAAMESLQPSE